MPWITPTLREVRELVRDDIAGSLPGADATVPNSILRVIADANSGLAHLNLLYLDWLSRQIMVDTAETEWLERFARIWLPAGRKAATFAAGNIVISGMGGTTIPQATRLRTSSRIEFETLEAVTLPSGGSVTVSVRALDPGVAGNVVVGAQLSFVLAQPGVDPVATVTVPGLQGGLDEESDDLLRARVLARIQQPPHGGAEHDYVAWALEVPGVTRAWAVGGEMGLGTVTVRFMMDELRSSAGGIPSQMDAAAVQAYIEPLRPVTVRDLFVVAPIPRVLDLTINNLVDDRPATRAAIEQRIRRMLAARAKPGQTIYRSWVGEAVSIAAGEDRHDLTFENLVMPSAGHIAVLGSIIYG